MKPEQARTLVVETFPQPFDKGRFHHFVNELLNGFDETKAAPMAVPDAFAPHVRSCARLGTYESPDGELADVLIVHTTEPWKLERTRTALRDFVAHKLKRGDSYKEAGLVAFVAPDARSWRFSFVRMEYESKRDPKTGKIAVEERLTPARRFSYIVGENESCHTAQSRFLDLLQDTETKPTLAQIEFAFSVETVTKEFFEQYKALFLDLKDELDDLTKKDKTIAEEFAEKKVKTEDFAKKLMGQIVFLYFLQKKGWLGVPKGGDWGDGPHNFLRQLFDGKFRSYKNFFNDILEHLFYDTLATDRRHEAWCDKFKCRIPFLNGGLFEPLRDYDWQKTDIVIPDKLFSNTKPNDKGDIGTGILDVFDRYNFTVNEAEPLEKEVAIDPEMLGKVFENLLSVAERKSKGSFYTPREIVHYMCQESLINYLDTAVNSSAEIIGTEKRKQALFGDDKAEQTLLTAPIRKELVPRADIETFIHSGDQASHYEAARVDGTRGKRQLPKSIETHARLIDEKLVSITVCDLAIGSGAFPVGMMQEIVRARSALTPYFNDVHERTAYHFKRHAIQNCIYGVDIDPGAVEIAKLRLWLSLVVDEDDVKQIKPLPNLDYKIVSGNSILGVEKTLLNKLAYERLEELKPRYFDATDRKQKEKFKREIDDLIHELTNGKETFDFEIYFSEVFHRKKGFDVIIGNPPYLESRSPNFSDSLKTKMQEAVASRWPGLSVSGFIPRGADLLIYFLEIGIRLVNSNGDVVLITQNAWLDTEYGKKFQLFLLEQTHVTLVVDSDFKHFDGQDGPNINTVITFFHGKKPFPDKYITFVRFQGNLGAEAFSSLGEKLEVATANAPFRQYQYSNKILRKTKWGILLSLDDIVLDLLAILEAKAKPIETILQGSFSFGQGLNLTKNYFVSAEQVRQMTFLKKALVPILTTDDGAPFDIQTTQNHLVNQSALSKDELRELSSNEIGAFDFESTSKQPPLFIMPRGIGGTHFCALNSVKAFSSSCVDLYSKPSRIDEKTIYGLWVILNSSLTWLLREVTGRKNLGGGMLKAEAVDMKELPLYIEMDCTEEIKAIIHKVRRREAMETTLELETAEHKELDELVFDSLKLPREKRSLIVEGLRNKIISRASKAQT